MSNEELKRGQIKAASLMFAAVLTLEIADEFTKTFNYRHDTKAALNRLIKLLEKDLDQGYYDLMQQDEQLVHGISEKLKDLAKQVAHLEISEICAVAECIPEIIKRDNNIKFKKLTA